MRFGFCVLSFAFCVALLSATYADPPHEAVRTYNSDYAAGALRGNFGGTLSPQVPTVEDPFHFSGGKLLSILPGVDNRISADGTHELVWVWIAAYPPSLLGQTSEAECPDDVQLEFLNEELHGNFIFNFRGNPTTVPFDSSTPLLVSMPTIPGLENSNGSELLSIQMAGTVFVTFRRTITTKLPGENGCNSMDSRVENATFSRSFEDSISYSVEAGTPAFFLLRPALREQYFRTNRFNSLLGARRQIYRAEVMAENDSFGNASFREFNITTDAYSVQHVSSFPQYNASNMSAGFSSEGFSNPAVFGAEEFAFVYGFNSSYEGLGWQTLGLRVRDDFGKEYTYSDRILSRDVAYGNGSSESPHSPATRPYSPFTYSSLTLPVVFLGGVILMIILLRFRPR